MERIPIDEHLRMFADHLSINERTILSAKFGDGKTYFLNEFRKTYEGEYYFVTLYPVNYSVAENADIFEYIKRDIIVQLAKKDMLSNIDFVSIATSICSWENTKELIQFLFTFLKNGSFYNELLEKGEAFFKKYDEKKETYKKFLTNIETQKGSIYEYDAYTKIIYEAINYIKNNKNKKTVLIIEDLDRIDPAHLFRILNVLGAHLDCQYWDKQNTSSNKFGFDNIVTVFDYEIARHIFYHFYGQKANYEGYINKFKIHPPFCFSINSIAQQYLKTYIQLNCRISLSDLQKGYSSEILEELSKCTVRDICHMLDDMNKQIKDVQIPSYDNKYYFNSITPLTLYISFLIRLGKNRNCIEAILIDSLSDIDLLNLLGVFLTQERGLFFESSMIYNNKTYEINMIKESNVIQSLSIKLAQYSLGNENPNINAGGAIRRIIRKALEYVII